MNKHKRLLSFVLAAVMIVGMIPLTAIADDGQIDHIETCLADCTGESCECACHQAAQIDETPEPLCEECNTTETNEDGSIKHAADCETLKPTVLCDKCNATETNEDGTLKHTEDCETLKPTVLCDKCEATKAEDGTIIHAEGCSQYVEAVESTLFEDLMEVSSVEEMYLMILQAMGDAPDDLYTLTTEELTALYALALELNNTEPSEDYVDLCDTLQYLAGEFDLNGAMILAESPDKNLTVEGTSDGITIESGKLTKNRTWNVGERVFFKGTVEIPEGVTLTININTGSGTKSQSLVHKYNGKALFLVTGGTLIINGDSTKNLVIDGRNKWTVNKTDINNIQFTPEKHEDGGSSGYTSTEAQIVLKNGTVQLKYVEFKNIYSGIYNGSGEGKGGAINVSHGTEGSANLKAEYCTFNHCAALYGGAALYFNSQDITGAAVIDNCNFIDCYSDDDEPIGRDGGNGGGIIRCIGPNLVTLKLTNCNAYNNVSLGSGGFISWNAGRITPLEIQNCKIYNNMTGSFGGAIYVLSRMTLQNTEIYNNQARIDGGGIYVGTWSSSSYVEPSKFKPEPGDITLSSGVSIHDNKAVRNGGGIYFSVQRIKVVANNDAAKQALKSASPESHYVKESDYSCWYIVKDKNGNPYSMKLTIDGASIYANSAQNGGGIYMTSDYAQYDSVLKINSATIKNNTADANGGGVYVSRVGVDIGTASGSSVTISDNKANNGGGMYVARSDATYNFNTNLYGGTVTRNTATGNGGGIYQTGLVGNLNVYGGSVTSNTANGSGGGLYVENGKIVMSGGLVKSNTAKVNGGGYAVVATGSNTATVTTTGGNVDSNNAVLGGGIFLSGQNAGMTINGVVSNGVTNTSISGNSAVNGGGIYIKDGANLDIDIANINGNIATAPSGYTFDVNNIQGAGGGIFVTDGASATQKSLFTLDGNPIGIYGNIANIAADDVYASGTNSQLSLPAKEDMTIADPYYNATTGWFEDYNPADTKYKTAGLLSNPNYTNVERYRVAIDNNQPTVRAYVDEAEYTKSGSNVVPTHYINGVDQYVCITLGVINLPAGSLTIQKIFEDDVADVFKNQIFVFTVSGETINNETIEFQVRVMGSNPVTVYDLPYGTYTVKEDEAWSWRFTCTVTPEVTLSENKTADSIQILNALKKDQWLDYDVGKTNVTKKVTESG